MLTDPTFDPAGTVYELPAYTLHKLQGPAIEAGELGRVDVVLLSHEHHFDNLDRSGRALLPSAGRVLTTAQGAATLAHGAIGLAPWESSEISAPGGAVMRVTAAPARHGPAHADRGPVIGFVLAFDQDPDQTVYFSGDTVWYDGVREVAARFRVTTALLCLGAARVSAVGDWPLTFTAEEAVEAARAMPSALIVPLHFEGWEHFSESREDVDRAFTAAGLSDRLRWPKPGKAVRVGGDCLT